MEINNKFSSRHRVFLVCIVIVMAVYLPVNYFGFVNMDDTELFERFHNSDTAPSFSTIFLRSTASRYYRPLLTLFYYMDSRIWGQSMQGYHFFNYFFHILNAALVYLIVLKLLSDNEDKRLYAGAAMLMAGLHPLTCESVAWVSGRSDIAGTFFVLLAVNFYFIKSCLRFVLVPLAIFMGLLCKENALAGIPLIILLDLYINYSIDDTHGQIFKNTGVWTGLMVLVLVGYLLLRTNGWQTHAYTVFLSHTGTGKAVNRHRKAAQLFYIFPVIGFYLKKFIIPFPLNFAISKINIPMYWVLFASFLGFNVICGVKRKKKVIFLSCILICSFLPALPVALGAVSWMPLAERYLYLSVSAVAVCAVSIASIMTHTGFFNKKNQKIFFCVIVIVCALTTLNRELVWKDSHSLWADTLKKNPDSSMVLFKYGQAYGGDIKIRACKKAIALSNDFKYIDLAYLEIAVYECSVHNYGKSLEYIDLALKRKKNYHNLCQVADIVLSFTSSNQKDKKKWLKRAIQYYLQAYKKRKDAFVLFKAATIMKQARNDDRMIPLLKKLILNHPDSIYTVYAKKQLGHCNN